MLGLGRRSHKQTSPCLYHGLTWGKPLVCSWDVKLHPINPTSTVLWWTTGHRATCKVKCYGKLEFYSDYCEKRKWWHSLHEGQKLQPVNIESNRADACNIQYVLQYYIPNSWITPWIFCLKDTFEMITCEFSTTDGVIAGCQCLYHNSGLQACKWMSVQWICRATALSFWVCPRPPSNDMRNTWPCSSSTWSGHGGPPH